jgi:hypothetical protein
MRGIASAQDTWTVSLTQEKSPEFHWIDHWLGPQVKVSLALLFIKPRFPGI